MIKVIQMIHTKKNDATAAVVSSLERERLFRDEVVSYLHKTD